MSIRWARRQIGEVVIVDISGRMTIDQGCWQLDELFDTLFSGEGRRVIFNLTDCDKIDASGIGTLVSGMVRMSDTGIDLKFFLNIQRAFLERLRPTKLLSLFDIYEDEAAALASFGHRAEVDTPIVIHSG
jgi:anti-sigma B factor antagonist